MWQLNVYQWHIQYCRGKQAKCVHSVCSQVYKDLLSSCYDGSQTFSYSQKLSVINTVQHSDPLLFQELFSTDQLNRVLCYRSPCSFIRVGNSLFATSLFFKERRERFAVSLTKNERFARKPKSEFPTLSLIHVKRNTVYNTESFIYWPKVGC